MIKEERAEVSAQEEDDVSSEIASVGADEDDDDDDEDNDENALDNDDVKDAVLT